MVNISDATQDCPQANHEHVEDRPRITRRHVLGLGVLALAAASSSPAIGTDAEGRLTWAMHISLAPTWFDPAETSGIITPFLVMYALHDAMLKPMPGQRPAPCLAESWSGS